MDELRSGVENLILRPVVRADIPVLHALFYELAVYEKLEDAFVVTVADLERSLIDESAAEAILAEYGGLPVGYAVYFMNYSTFLGRAGMYLEDVYVKPERRRQGIGMALMKAVARIAKGRGCRRYEWVCLDWNTPSIEFYKSIGARPMDDWTVFRLEGEALENFTESL